MKAIHVGMVGNVDSGKSSSIGHLISKLNDDGNGKLRSMVAVHPHEIKSGRTSDISMKYADFGNNRITFIDLAGHEKYLKTTITGIGSIIPDLIVVCVDRYTSAHKMTREHIGLATRMGIPFVILLTKIDLYEDKTTNQSLENISLVLKKYCRRKTYEVKTDKDIELCLKTYVNFDITPVFRVSNVTNQGYDKFEKFLSLIDNFSNSKFKHPSKFIVERVYHINGVGTVLSGYNGGPPISIGTKVYLNGNYQSTVRSIHNDYRQVSESIPTGTRGCIALRGRIECFIRRGFIVSLTPCNLITSIMTSVEILSNHSTTIKTGYKTVIHCGSTVVTATVDKINDNETVNIRGGTKALIKFKFENPRWVEIGQGIFFRDGRIIGDGIITEIFE